MHCLKNPIMLFAMASLFLSAIWITQANTIEEDVTIIEPLSEELFIYDVISDATAAQLKGSLKSAGVEIRQSFKVLGTRQYIFVVVGDLSQLTFPVGSVVTQYPAQHTWDFHKLVGAGGWDGNVTQDALDDNNLLAVIWEFVVPQGTSTAQFKKMLQDSASLHNRANKKLKPVLYVVVGRYPVKFFFFMNLDENAVQKVILKGRDVLGGPANTVMNVLRLGKM